MRIAVASGKGGTGKTTIATSLALALDPKATHFVDCDVEAPNAHLYLKPALAERAEVGVLIPQVDERKCTACGRCMEVCEFHAITVIGQKTLVFPELCHGCGSCTLVCPEGAISERLSPTGVLEHGPTTTGISFGRGVMNVGEPMAVPIIRELKSGLTAKDSTWETVIVDAPPGASCPVVEALRGADFVLLVTEPTPFGLHDLKLAVELVHELGLPAGVIVNRDGIGDTAVDTYCREAGIPILMRIPMQRDIAAELAQGKPLVAAFPEYLPRFRELYAQITATVSKQQERAR
jgi:MinD superfamily P-loop ATPase